MIVENNLVKLLELLGFVNELNKYVKYFPMHDCYLKVDFNSKLIEYPENNGLIINERQTCNFSSNENFVVLECINRLLEKGYQPKHLELEPKWKLGHGASGGRADILVKDYSDKPLLLIECKTWGREFDRAWKDTLNDGDQLFSYAQQIADVKFLCLYASEIDNSEVVYQSNIIAHKDNDDYLETNPQLLSFKNVKDLRQRFAVWRDTYQKEFITRGIFEDNIQAYHIGKDKYTLDDLTVISRSVEQKQYHKFATILRQYNVSGRENAFDILVNLFLCKIVDESKNAHDLKFYWKGTAYDSYFDLQDRLQQLYQIGMREFLGEEVTYIDNAAIDKAFRYVKRDPNVTKNTIKDYFRQLKFFTNSDFAFLDVHNERLFYQNAKILLDVVKMWQDYRLKSETQNQFLGDMFEGFLDAGVKQSEGQFFTPMPLVRFIMSSLPLENLIKDSHTTPRCIDYACGAGHFLTELAQQITPFIEKYHKGAARDYYAELYGIEKEYRLSKVAKVSAFMYGQDEIQIIYGDALAHHTKLKHNSFQVLVANPPYSVKGFLETLSEADRDKYSLSATIASLDTSNSIETFFIERAKQLLAVGGIAAIIVPSSVLSNGDATYTQAREIMLQWFDIVAIVELGSGTFGKTGTNTVTLFLRKKEDKPAACDYYRERVEDWFSLHADGVSPDEEQYQDDYLVKRYCQHIGINIVDYVSLLKGEPSAMLLDQEMFFSYRKAFDNLTTTKNLLKNRSFRDKSEAEQQAQLQRNYIRYCREQEMEKLYYFVLSQSQNNPVVVVKAPADNKEQKQFLGYEWSNAKGNEGIKLIRNSDNHHVTPLYDEINRYNPHKINNLIQANFKGETVAVPEELCDYATIVPLAQMLDFNRVEFNKQISLALKSEASLTSKYPLEKLGDIEDVKIKGGDTFQEKYQGGVNSADIPFFKVSDMNLPENQIIMNQANNYVSELIINTELKATIFPKNTIIFPKVGQAIHTNKKRILVSRACFDNNVMGITLIQENHLLAMYLFHYFIQRVNLTDIASKANPPSISAENLKQLKIPVPPMNIQKLIIAECQAIDDLVFAAQNEVVKNRQIIEKLINDIKAPQIALGKLCIGNPQYGATEKAIDGNPSIDIRYIRITDINEDGALDDDFKTASNIDAKYLLDDNDFLFARSGNTVGKTFLYRNAIGKALFAGYLIRFKMDQEKLLPKFLKTFTTTKRYWLWIRENQTGSSQPNINGQIYSQLLVPVPPLEVQQQLVSQIEVLEVEIAAAQAIIAAAPAQKQAILHKYLD
ncbi:MAG: N-6 DNA methylase [Burkholderiales bacterium]|nr:N-6 DNA methylase [Burkholderiales bacterium]